MSAYSKRISSRGLTRSQYIRALIEERSIPEPNTGCWLWMCATSSCGYGSIGYEKRRWVAHRLSWEGVNGPIAEGLLLCHKCDTPACVNPDHMFVGTMADNMRDMVKKRRFAVAKRGNGSKLTELQAEKIKHDLRSQSAIASEYGIHQSMVSLIKSGRCWTAVGEACSND